MPAPQDAPSTRLDSSELRDQAASNAVGSCRQERRGLECAGRRPAPLKNYQQEMRDGRDDEAHHRDHFKKRNFKKDEDRRAYEAGYQAGHHGDFRDHR